MILSNIQLAILEQSWCAFADKRMDKSLHHRRKGKNESLRTENVGWQTTVVHSTYELLSVDV